MKKQYKLTALALTACLLTGCGAGETSALENTTAEKQPTEPVAETSAETFTETASVTTEVPQETTAQENPVAPKEITIDFTGIAEFHPEGTPAQPYSLEILSETYNNITFADEWYNASEDVSLPMIGENWDCFYDEITLTSGTMENSAFLMARTACMYWNIRQTNGTSMVITPALRTGSSMGHR